MKKEVRKKAVIIGVVIGALILCAVPILIHMSDKQITKLGEIEKTELKGMQTTVPEGYTGIYTVEDLKNVKENLAGNYILMNDIDLESKPFRTIGLTGSESFKGILDGNGYKISNLTISQDNQYVGLFGYVTGGTIKNLTLENVDITSIYTAGNAYVGGIAGSMREGNIENVSVSGSIKEEGESSQSIYIGGLIGNSANKITVTDSHTATNIKVNTRSSVLGGLIGNIESSNNSTIKNSYAIGNITSETYSTAGGLIGYVNIRGTTITDSYATGDIIVNSGIIGGLIGNITDCELENVYATGNIAIKTRGNIGGLIGRLQGLNNDVIVDKAYATGKIEVDLVTSDSNVGGLIGVAEPEENINISNTYSTANIEVKKIEKGEVNVAGLVGMKEYGSSSNKLSINNSYTIGKLVGGTNVASIIAKRENGSALNVTNTYWCPETTGVTGSSYGTKKVLSEMLWEDTYVGWDFDTVWQMEEEKTLPYLRNMPKPESVNVSEYTHATYKVEHYKQKVDKTGYELAETEDTIVTTNTETGEQETKPLKGEIGSTVTAVAKEYEGFTENQTAEGRVPSGVVIEDGSLTLKLYYDRNTYKVTLNKNGGTVNTGDVTNYTYGVGVTLPLDITKEGYTFGGWYDNRECTGTEVTNIEGDETGDKIYHAKWIAPESYVIVYSANGGTINDASYATTYTYGVGATLPTNVTKQGYNFAGWYDNAGLTGTAVTNIGTNETGTKVYYAKWAPKSGTTEETGTRYVVEYYKENVNGEYEKDESATLTLYGETDSLVTAQEKEYEGYELNSAHPESKIASNILPDGSLVLKAYYKRNTYKITYVINGGRINDTNYVKSYTYGVGGALPTNVTKQGYNFAGWYENSDLSGTQVTNIGTNETGEKVYYAKWTPKSGTTEETGTRYIVEYYKENVNGEYEKVESETLTKYGETDSIAVAPQTTFTGFALDLNNENNKLYGIITPDGSLVLKVYYRRNAYTVTLNTNGGTIVTGEITKYKYGIETNLPQNVEKPGYTFDGWYDNAEFTGTAVTKIGVADIGNKTYYAKWIAESGENGPTYTIKYYKQNTAKNGYEEVLEDTKTLHGQTDTLVTIPEKAYTGFKENVAHEGRNVAGIITSDGSLSLSRYYDREEYNIVYVLNDGIINDTNYVTTYTYGIGANLPQNVTKQGYVFDGWYENAELTGTAVEQISNTDAEIKIYYASWLKDTDGDGIPDIEDDNTQVAYKVEHYKQNLSQDGYEAPETENLQGNLGSTVTAVSKEYTGFSVTETDETVASGEVLVDGSLTLKLYYNRNSYKVTLNTNDGTIVGQNLENYTYGVGATLPTNVTKQGFAFDGWYEDEACEGTQVTSIGITETGEKTYYAKMLTDANGNGIPDEKEQGTQVAYTVEHYKQNLSQNGYDEPERETKQGGLGTIVNAVAKTYKGFALTTTENTLPSGEVKADGSLTLKLYYNRNTYTVVLNTDGGEIESGKEVTSYTYGIGAALPTNVTKQGYVFRGWFEQRDFLGTAVTEIGTEDTGDKTYYAKMLKDTDGDGTPDIEDPDTKINYTVLHYRQNLNQNGYDEPERETKQADLGSAVTATPKEYPGFTVTITNDTVLNGTVTENNALILKLYYNRNTYKLPLNIDGEIEEIEYVYGEEITLPTDKEKEGYTFEGWYDNEDLTGEPAENVDTSKIDPENPPTYYIKWTANEGIAYTVKHYKQEGNTNTYTLADTENLTGTTGETVTARPKTYEGYIENATANERIPSGIVKGDGSLELVLIYDTIKLTVTFKDGETVLDTQTIVYGEGATAPSLTKAGYVLRWDKTFNNVTSDLEVNAVWLKDTDGDGIPDIEDDDTQVRYTVEHYVQNTDLTTYTLQETENTLTGNLGSTVNATPKTYTGFTLTQTDSTIANGTVVDDGSLVLKLYYNRNNYAVTLNKNEGTINSGNVLQYTYGIGVALPTNVTKEGYVFRGWYDNANLTGTAVTTIGVTETGAKIYYAKWLKDTDGDGIPDIEDDDTQVRYTVEHYKQNLAQNGYDEAEIENLQGQLGSIATAQAKTYTGFSVAITDETVPSGTVVDDGSLVLKLYYDRENYEITYETNGGTIEDDNYVTSYTYGIVVNLPTNVTKEGFTFGGWYENIVEEGARAYTRSVEEKTIVSQTKETDIGAKTYYASWNANGNTAYKVEHYKQGETGYILADTDNLTAETESTVTAVPKTYEGYEENINHEERVAEGTVVGNGSLVLKLYYDMLTYEVTFKDGEKVLSTQTINYGENAVAPSLAKEGYILRWDKEYNNVKTDLSINAIWLRDTDGDGIPDIEDDETLVEYIVRHYKQIGDKAEYELADTDTLQGQLGTVVTAIPKTYAGYEENLTTIARIPSGELTGGETLQLRLFYNTIKYEVIFKDGEQEVGRVIVPHGGTVEPPILTKEGYTLSWDKSLNNITDEQTINAVWTKVGETEQTYKVEHYVQTKEGKYTLKETDTLVGSIGDAVTASPKTYGEYVLDETNENTIKTGKIKEGSELTLKLYYNYKRYEVIFKDGEEEVGRVEVIHGEKAEPPELTKEGYILSWDKNINNITKEQTITAVWTKDPNYKDPNAKPEDNTNNKPTIDKLPDDGKEERPSILPKTGEEVVTLGAVIGLLGIAVAYFVKYKF